MKKIVIISAFLFTITVAFCSQQIPVGKATIKIIDEQGEPIVGATAGIAFNVPSGTPGGPVLSHEGATDNKGCFSASDSCNGIFYYGAKKDGYYEAHSIRYMYKDVKLGRLTPENPELTVMLKKIINPVPMYVRKVALQTPELDKPIGFDFEVGDWIAPYGKGIQSDFIFTVLCRWQDMNNFYSQVNVSFKNPNDGLLEFATPAATSSLLSPHAAPMDGFQSTWGREVSADPVHGRKNWGTPKTQNFIFRTRTVVDENGKTTAANYGKIYGGIDSGGESGGKPYITFTYYYNPDSQSRSLEFDPKQNLAKEEKYPFPP
ncbi:hypothetical protein M2103_000872 [Ereboglobus sp. PH5-5]|uniref:hypothetical protein n=1 Tax=Ereboglobus sp. PH5-5 TaxID=2940529 RepID=UPI0024052E69|nr:hypothetical protein [Ereboglobus sp. PH5-5]MDF9832658.1 hypothetical protein [Ereboglobus sp. PH5-5]